MYKRGTTGPIKSPAGLTDRDFLSKAELKVSAPGEQAGLEGKVEAPRLILDRWNPMDEQMVPLWTH